MALLIDGYNLLNSVAVTGRGAGRRAGSTSLERSRAALLDFLAAALEPAEISRTTVVFDAAGAPPGLPRVLEHGGLTVRFAAGYENADAMIEELIRAETAPRRLTVVSSDHRIQRAARRRRAKAVDSDVWFGDLLRRRRERKSPAAPAAKPPCPLLEEDVRLWLDQFGGEEALDKLLEEPSPGHDSSGDEAGDLDNPFPPGYAEDLE